jgi:hypothetical protein
MSTHERSKEYRRLLDEFGANKKKSVESVRYLESLGFRTGQARSAVYQYRKSAGLVKERAERITATDD